MAVLIGSARIDEHGNISGGQAGDQNGREVCTEPWYLHKQGWVVLRPKDAELAEKIAADMEYACSNPNIGYDQSQRNTLWTAASKVGYDCSKVTKPVETDCSALVRVCCAYAGIVVGDFNTATEAKTLMATAAFSRLTAKKYTESSDYLKRGDILVTKVQGHTVVCLTNGAKEQPVKKTISQIADEVIAGKWSTGAERRRLLEAAGYVYSEVQAAVNAKLKAKKTIDEIADEVIASKWGNGAARKKALEAAGYNYAEVQAAVNAKKNAGVPSKAVKYVGKVTAMLLNVRSTPEYRKDGSNIVGVLGFGNLIDVCDAVTGKDGGSWLYVRIAGMGYQYVSAEYIAKA